MSGGDGDGDGGDGDGVLSGLSSGSGLPDNRFQSRRSSKLDRGADNSASTAASAARRLRASVQDPMMFTLSPNPKRAGLYRSTQV